MIEELKEYLIRYGWAEDIADDVHDAVYRGKGKDEEIENVKKAMACLDDSEHDYTGEMLECIVAWRKEVGEI